MKKLALFPALVFGLTACSSGHSPKNDVTQTAEAKRNYRFVLNGCDTTKQEFAALSESEVNAKACEGLEDDQLNKSCAEPLRRAYFDKICEGMAWTPKYAAKPQVPDQKPFAFTPNPDVIRTAKISRAAEDLITSSITPTPGLTGPDKAFADRLALDLSSCGFSYFGPKCLDVHSFMVNFSQATPGGDPTTFVSEMQLRAYPTPIAFIFSIESTEPSVKIGKITVAKVAKLRGHEDLAAYLKDSKNLTPLLEMTVAANAPAEALKRLQNPRDIRELYHMSELLSQSTWRDADFERMRTKLADIYRTHQNVIVQSADERYQKAILRQIKSTIPVDAGTLAAICEELVKSPSEEIQQLAALTLLDKDPTRTELKFLVVKALENSSYDVRRQAVAVLSRMEKSVDDENLILGKLNDRDTDVRREAKTAAEKLTLTPKHMMAVQQLTKSQNYEVRVVAARLFGRMDTRESRTLQIASLNDSDNNVRRAANEELQKSKLEPEQVPYLVAQFQSHNYEVRRNVVALLAKIDTPEATTALIHQMNDTDNDVRRDVATQLKKKSLDEYFVADLKIQFQSHNYEVRLSVANLLGQIKSEAALKAVEDQLIIESDGDVKAALIGALQKLKSLLKT